MQKEATELLKSVHLNWSAVGSHPSTQLFHPPLLHRPCCLLGLLLLLLCVRPLCLGLRHQLLHLQLECCDSFLQLRDNPTQLSLNAVNRGLLSLVPNVNMCVPNFNGRERNLGTVMVKCVYPRASLCSMVCLLAGTRSPPAEHAVESLVYRLEVTIRRVFQPLGHLGEVHLRAVRLYKLKIPCTFNHRARIRELSVKSIQCVGASFS